MLVPSKVIPFLNHADEHVRSLAVRYLMDAHDPSPATADEVWAAIDRYGAGRFNLLLQALRHLPQTESSLQRTLKALHTNGENEHHYQNVIRDLHFGFTLRFRDLIEESSDLSAEVREHLQQRFALASVPSQQLWEQLMELAAKAESESPECRRIAEALARSPETIGWAINVLNDPGIQDWREIYAVDVLGRMKHRASAGLIIAKMPLLETDDALAEECVSALARIGSVEVISSLREISSKLDSFMRMHAATVLGRIKLPQAESALFALLRSEPDLTARTAMAASLCELAATEPAALDALAAMYEASDWNDELADLHEDVPALFTMVGRPLPKSRKPAARAFTPTKPARALDWDDEADEELSHVSPQPAPGPPPPPQPTTIRRDTPKVGRNDPCPCGSGKKYKKCCAK